MSLKGAHVVKCFSKGLLLSKSTSEWGSNRLKGAPGVAQVGKAVALEAELLLRDTRGAHTVSLKEAHVDKQTQRGSY